jgi:hypothetical protein
MAPVDAGRRADLYCGPPRALTGVLSRAARPRRIAALPAATGACHNGNGSFPVAMQGFVEAKRLNSGGAPNRTAEGGRPPQL